ncbi:hypothetical protein K435DRAFT_717872 [Dendrothele bispora CBS 962.96]|uniref:Fungal-type protein kinase domain-containing protein n=1 Tax=Dendrothele bispora (strain CBS 962.96) TaxID=1314807 RepID=A0A4S8MGZ4_DENBC|nr:hypothetical protein K435DRAFT_717872 [Dendrothele bispora CBS 962.96]
MAVSCFSGGPNLKTRVKDTVYHPIGDYDCLIDQKFVQEALAEYPDLTPQTLDPRAERLNYRRIADFLDQCVKNCKSAYTLAHGKSRKNSRFGKLQQSGSHWWPGLTFFEYDKQTGDGVGGAEPLKPDFVGAHDKPDEKERCFWAPTRKDCVSDLALVGIGVPGEVKDQWPELIRQAATYARAMTSAVPLRSFSVAIGVNHKHSTLRILIFHRGGLTTSEALNLKTEYGCLAVQQILFSVYLWQKPEDAGFPAFINGHTCLLPDPRNIKTGVPLIVTTHLYHALSIRGRGSFVLSLDLSQPPLNDSTKSSTKSPPHDSNNNLRRSMRRIKSPGKYEPALPETAKKARTTSTILATKARSKKAILPMSSPNLPEAKEEPADIEPIRATLYHNVELTFTPPPCYHALQTLKKEVLDELLRYPLIAKFSWPSEQKRGLEPRIYNVSNSAFGTPVHLLSFEVILSDGSVWSNAHFLPTSSQADTAFTPLLQNTREDPDCRSMWVTKFVGVGESLEECDSAWDLCECLLQASFGWLSYYVRGYLHRDISVGNILKIKNGPRQRDPFSTRSVKSVLDLDKKEVDTSGSNTSDLSETLPDGVSRLDIGGDRFWEDLTSSLEEQKSSDDQAAAAKYKQQKAIVDMARELEDVAQDLGVTTECKAFLSDCDMSAQLEGYFDRSEHGGSLSGTAEFMNKPLREAIEDKSHYLQSPVDDMHSLFWTALWCTLFNVKQPERSPAEEKWRRKLQGTVDERDSAMNDVLENGTEEEHSSILRDMTPLFKDWRNDLLEINSEWKAAWRTVEKGQADEKLLVFHYFAFQGILGFTQLVKKHKARLSGTK